MWTPPAGSLSAAAHQEHAAAGATQKLLCLCVPGTPVSSPLTTQPCTPVRERPHQQQTLGQRIDSVFRLCGGFLVHSDDRAHLCVLHNDTILQVGSLKLR